MVGVDHFKIFIYLKCNRLINRFNVYDLYSFKYNVVVVVVGIKVDCLSRDLGL